MHIVIIFFSTFKHNYGEMLFFFYYRIKCNGIPIQQIRELSGRQLIGSGDHRHWQPMRFSLTTNNECRRTDWFTGPLFYVPGFLIFAECLSNDNHILSCKIKIVLFSKKININVNHLILVTFSLIEL